MKWTKVQEKGNEEGCLLLKKANNSFQNYNKLFGQNLLGNSRF